MTATFSALAFLVLAGGKQVAFVDLSLPPTTTETGPQTVWARGGGVLYHGDRPHPLPGTPPISLRLNQITTRQDGAFLKYIVEVTITNTGKASISLPIGDDPVPLLSSGEKDRRFLYFDVALVKNSRSIGGGESASNSGHPESSATLEPGDTVVFWIPVGSWMPNDPQRSNQEIRVSVLLNRKALEDGKDWSEAVGEKIVSENTLPLP